MADTLLEVCSEWSFLLKIEIKPLIKLIFKIKLHSDKTFKHMKDEESSELVKVLRDIKFSQKT